MKPVTRLLLWPMVALVVLLAPSLSAEAHPSSLGKRVEINIPCGVSEVPYSVYSMPITQTEALSLAFDAQGPGLVTFVVNNFQTSYWARTLGNTRLHNTLRVANVTPGTLGVLQLSATVAADNCPSGGMVVGSFVLTVSP
jgi:hypothetical protein